jgi:hypothetical protein
MKEQREAADKAFDAVDGTIDRMTKTVVFSHCKPSPYSEVAIDHEFLPKK